MPITILKMLVIAILVAYVGPLHADMVILKSGEMYQTRRAWKENGSVKYYRNGRVVAVDAGEVERLIQFPSAVETLPPPDPGPVAAPNTPPVITDAIPPPVPLASGDEAGFLGLEWGRALSEFDGLTSVGTDPAYGGVQQFSPASSNRRFGRASVDTIVYGFWQGGLYTITVWTSNFLDFRELKTEAFRRFGPGQQRDEAVEKYHWMGASADRLLAYDYDSDTGFLWMRSRALHDKVGARFPD